MMVKLHSLKLFLLAAIAISLTASTHQLSSPIAVTSDYAGSIYLYGEKHGVASLLDKEYELWLDYYNNKNMRHLFIETPYFSAELLNIWMKSGDDIILDEFFIDIQGTQGCTPANKEFYQKIKKNAPETVFHGTDVGHQYNSTGKRYLKYLEQNGQKDSLQYRVAQDNIAQGKKYYGNLDSDDIYRENMMAQNFIRELNSIPSQDIMGIYGGAHIVKNTRRFGVEVDTMATQLSAHFDKIYTLDLEMQPITCSRSESIIIEGREYMSHLIGWADISSWSKTYVAREYWQIDDAYESVRNNPKPGDVLPYDNYPTEIQTGDVFMIKYTKPDGGIDIVFYRADGNTWNNVSVTERFDVAPNQ